MAMGLDGLGQRRSSINVTPLVDVLLVLLIIFIMVTPLLSKALSSGRTATKIPSKLIGPLCTRP